MMVAFSATMQAGKFGGRVGMRKAAADSSPVADRGMRDMGDRLRQQWRVRGDFRRFLEIDMPRQRTDPQDLASTDYARAARAISPISTISSGEIKRRFIAGIRL